MKTFENIRIKIISVKANNETVILGGAKSSLLGLFLQI